jgi:photosystem II stability/assembly factor-like uncharacterized protein
MLSLAACGGTTSDHTGPTSSTSTTSTSRTTSTSTQAQVPPVPGGGSSGGGSLPAGGPVPAGTEATSVTFISPSIAFILGTAPCDVRPCSAILRTTDRGAHWVGLAAPRQGISYPLGGGLWGLRFADAVHGYAFGQGLWETSNGGRSWHRAAPPVSTVLSLEAVADREIVALGDHCIPGQGCGSQMGLYHQPIGGSWSKIANLGALNNYGGAIAVHGEDVWVAAAARIYYSTDGGHSFGHEKQPCPAGGSNFGRPTSISDDGSHVYLLCTGQGFTGHTLKYVYATTGPGASWTLMGRPPTPGDGGEISAGSDAAIMIASYSAASWLYRSTDGGHTWRTVLTQDDGGAGWSDLGFTTPTDAVVVHGPAIEDAAAEKRPGRVLLSSNGGLSWQAAAF